LSQNNKLVLFLTVGLLTKLLQSDDNIGFGFD